MDETETRLVCLEQTVKEMSGLLEIVCAKQSHGREWAERPEIFRKYHVRGMVKSRSDLMAIKGSTDISMGEIVDHYLKSDVKINRPEAILAFDLASSNRWIWPSPENY